MEELTATDWIALYAALVASIAFIWNMYTWFTSGAKCRLSIGKGKIMVIPGEKTPKIKYIQLRIKNYGTLPTTIEGIGFDKYDSWFDRIRLRRASFLPMQMMDKLPHSLDIGAIWDGLMVQKDFEEAAYLRFNVMFSHKKKPASIMLRMNSQ